MKDVIKSGIHDLDLLRASAENYIRYMYEYIGIYQKYIDECDYKEDNFEKYYEEHRNITEYHFVNKGVQFLGEMLEKAEVPISNRNLRRLGKTYKGFPVILSVYADKVIETALNYIRNDDMLMETYINKVLMSGGAKDKLDFQYELLCRRVGKKWTYKPYQDLKHNIDNIKWE